MPRIEETKIAPRKNPLGGAVGCAACAGLHRCWVGQLGDVERERIQGLVRHRPFRKGDALQREGGVSPVLRVLREGLVLRTRMGKDGQDRPVGLVGLGASVGLLGFFRLSNQTSAVALGAGQLCEIPLESLRRHEVDLPSVGPALVREIVQVLGELATWSEATRLRSVGAQLAYALVLIADSQGRADVVLPTQAVLADLLGASRETIARTLLQFEQAQLLTRLDRRQIRLAVPSLRERCQGGDEAAAPPPQE